MSLAPKFMWAAALVSALGCAGPVSDGTYLGEPIEGLHGQLFAPEHTAVSNPVHLAILWYQNSMFTGGGPSAIVAQEIAYQGTFPINYTFNLYGPPPPDALGEVTVLGGSGKSAVGVLVAYEDLNGNGQLDTIPTDGTPIDRVLGTSSGGYGNDTSSFQIHYYSQTPPTLPAGLKTGFNLVVFPPDSSATTSKVAAGQASVVPFSTPVPINLTGQSELNLVVCLRPPERPVGFGPLPCGISRTTGYLRAYRSLTARQDDAGIWQGVGCRLYDADTPVNVATVSINGRPAPFDAARNAFALISTDGTVLQHGAMNVLEFSAPGYALRRFALSLPGEFEITAPGAGQRATKGAPLQVAWTAATQALEYRVRIRDISDPANPKVLDEGSSDELSGVSVPLHADKVSVEVAAQRLLLTNQFDTLWRTFERTREVELRP